MFIECNLRSSIELWGDYNRETAIVATLKSLLYMKHMYIKTDPES